MTKEETILKMKEMESQMTDEDRDIFWDLAQEHIPKDGLAIEVGTWRGASAFMLGEICRQKGARLICIDLFNGDLHDANKTDSGVSGNWIIRVVRALRGLPIHFLSGRSQDVLPFLANGVADFVFVDADHYIPWVKIDIEGYWDKVKKGGFYCGHDYTIPCDVKKVVDGFFGKPDGVKGAIWYVTKVSKKKSKKKKSHE